MVDFTMHEDSMSTILESLPVSERHTFGIVLFTTCRYAQKVHIQKAIDDRTQSMNEEW